jgi:hypothetical protein
LSHQTTSPADGVGKRVVALDGGIRASGVVEVRGHERLERRERRRVLGRDLVATADRGVVGAEVIRDRLRRRLEHRPLLRGRDAQVGLREAIANPGRDVRARHGIADAIMEEDVALHLLGESHALDGGRRAIARTMENARQAGERHGRDAGEERHRDHCDGDRSS